MVTLPGLATLIFHLGKDVLEDRGVVGRLPARVSWINGKPSGLTTTRARR
ncbi:MAG: hypothetical protein HYY24_14870 [Verrucomicrobia bacterium]|nr:hypothetical protein [Verrucomicrobiota bacterium]